MNREQRARIGQATVQILRDGYYTLPDGRVVTLHADLAYACAETQLYRPSDYARLIVDLAALPPNSEATTVTLQAATTLAAARDLVRGDPSAALLNFASAKNPGGGFLSGSQAQEESLARASALYATQQQAPQFYAYHRQHATCLYSDHLIFSPSVPVFRDDHDQLLADPWHIGMITAAAVNAGAVRQNEPQRTSEIGPAMQQRMRMIFALAAIRGVRSLVLGAWGCGVFRNDPELVATLFATTLAEPIFAHRFSAVVFAIYDHSPQQQVWRAFERIFTAN